MNYAFSCAFGKHFQDLRRLDFLVGISWDLITLLDRLGRQVKLYIPPELMKFVAVKYAVKTGVSGLPQLAASLFG